MKPYRLIVIPLSFLLLTLLSGCPPSGGGDSDSHDNNGSNCPIAVSGLYTLVVGDSTETSWFRVTQDDNWLTLIDLNNEPLSCAATEESNMEGAFETSCSFVVTQQRKETNFDVEATFDFTIYGTFINGGWYGTYECAVSFDEHINDFSFTITFDGLKIE